MAFLANVDRLASEPRQPTLRRPLDPLNHLPEFVQTHLPEIAIAGALAWGAGFRLYFVMFVFGLAGAMGWWELPGHLDVISHPLVLFATGLMALVELFADKLPILDSVWDLAHTVIRIPAGAGLAAAVFGDAGGAVALSAAILGGGIAATTHLSKSGTRAAANASPEPLSNMALSTAEDIVVLGGSWLAVAQPAIFLVLLAAFLIAMLALIGLLWRGAKRLLQAARRQPAIPTVSRDRMPPS